MEEKEHETFEQPVTKDEGEEIKDFENQNEKSLDEVVIPVKFNKEIKNLTASQAAIFAQKGMKFDLIAKDFEALREISRKSGKSVTQFIEQLKNEEYSKRKEELLEKCSGDEELAEHIVSLELGEASDLKGFEELKFHFPKIKSLEHLPEPVLERARLKGSLLLDEYLRYRLEEKRRAGAALSLEEDNANLSLGSQLNKKADTNPETLEFLKGLWR